MMVVCKDRLDTIKANQRSAGGSSKAVEADITALLSGKSYDDLVTLQRRIQEKLTSGEPVDTDYWEGLLKKLLVWKAKVGTLFLLCSTHHDKPNPCSQAKLKALHEVVVRNRLEQLRKRQRDEALLAQEELLAGVARSASKKWGADAAPALEVLEIEVIPVEEMEEYDRAMSPVLLDITKLPPEEREIDIFTEAEDRRTLVSVFFVE